MDRKPHLLTGRKRVAIPRYFCLFDTETHIADGDGDDQTHTLRHGVAVWWQRPHGRHREKTEWLEFTAPNQFWEFLLSRVHRKTKVWVLARNLAFDFTIVQGWQYLYHHGFKCLFFHARGRTVIIKVSDGSRTLVFLDILNLFSEPLAKTGERIGLEKLSIDFETCNDQELARYCRRDVEIELRNWQDYVRFIESQKLCSLAMTIGSTAWKTYFTNYYKNNIWIHNIDDGCQLEREAYYGGRVECFYLGEYSSGSVTVCDANSLYPFVMASFEYPYRYKGRIEKPQRSQVNLAVFRYAVIADCEIETDEPVYPLREDKTIFPVGRFRTVLSTPELKWAMEHGHLRTVYEMVWYDKTDLFSEYVLDLYQKRLEYESQQNKTYANICKLLLNSLYGKFAQWCEEWSLIGEAPDGEARIERIWDVQEHRWYVYRYLLGQVWERTGQSEGYNSFPAIAAHVTAYGRMLLWYYITLAGIDNVLYCDTDSLFVTEKGLAGLLHRVNPHRLGYLKIEKQARYCCIHGPKDYVLDDRAKIKGIRANATRVTDTEFRQQQWPSILSALETERTGTYIVKTIHKRLVRRYTKGQVTETGRVIPHVRAGSTALFPQAVP